MNTGTDIVQMHVWPESSVKSNNLNACQYLCRCVQYKCKATQDSNDTSANDRASIFSARMLMLSSGCKLQRVDCSQGLDVLQLKFV